MNYFTNVCRPRLARGVGVLAGLAMTGMVWAQEALPPTAPLPPNPTKPDEPPAVLSFLLTIVMVALVVFANAVATKRGHQD